jgi:hypothetical protein
MKVQVMNHLGHETFEFTEAQRSEGLALLEKCLSDGGVVATRESGSREYVAIKDPDQAQDENLAIPQLKGG